MVWRCFMASLSPFALARFHMPVMMYHCNYPRGIVFCECEFIHFNGNHLGSNPNEKKRLIVETKVLIALFFLVLFRARSSSNVGWGMAQGVPSTF